MIWRRSCDCVGSNHHTALSNKSWSIATSRQKRPSERKPQERSRGKSGNSCERKGRSSSRSDLANSIGVERKITSPPNFREIATGRDDHASHHHHSHNQPTYCACTLSILLPRTRRVQ